MALENFSFRIVKNGIETGKLRNVQRKSLEEAQTHAGEITAKTDPGAMLVLYRREIVSTFLTKSSQARLFKMITMDELKRVCGLTVSDPNKAAEYELELIKKYGKTVKGLK